MSRLTAAQVIALGEYLEPDFEPSTLTVAQLLGVFGYHNVNYPSQYTKPRLVQLFNDEVKANASKLRRQRIKKESSQASDDGITDGLTGRPINEGKKPVTRRSSRRSSRAPPEQLEEPEPAPAKRRRSSAQPSLGGPSRQKSKSAKPVEPVLVEESEPEEEEEVAPRKVGRSKKSTTDAGSETRRVSQAFPEDSGWEDNNIFQSGAESSSPARPPPRRTRRTSTSARPAPKSRKSLSAPPQYASESPERGTEPARLPRAKPPSTVKLPSSAKPRSTFKPPSNVFDPQLPPDVQRETRSSSRSRRGSAAPEVKQERLFMIPSQVTEEQETDLEEMRQMEALREDIASPAAEVEPEMPVVPTEDYQEPEDDAVSEPEEYTDEQVAAVSKRISEGGQVVRQQSESKSQGHSFFTRLVMLLLFLSSSSMLYEYKRESSEIGFCTAGTTTNPVLEERQARAAAVELCQRENMTTLHVSHTGSAASPVPTGTASASGQQSHSADDSAVELCPPPALLPLPWPETCTPCPRHATCTPSSITCENGYVLRSHPLLYYVPIPDSSPPNQLSYTTFTRPRSLLATDVDVPELIYSAVSTLFDGLPGLGAVAFPPRCVADPRRRRHINGMGKSIETFLAAERGKRLCSGEGAGLPEITDIEQAKKWGRELEKLRDESMKKTSPNLLPLFNDTFNEAITQLVDWGVVFMAEDKDGTRYIASKNPSLDVICTLTVKSRETWAQWRASVIGSALLFLSALVLKRRRAQNAAENERVAGLVQIALDLLRNQELAYHTDPVTAPHPYLSSVQLRDLVLQDEHSVSARTRLWHRVERVVEGNTNVRTNLEEVEGGDEQRVWHWVGSAGKLGAPPATGRHVPVDERNP